MAVERPPGGGQWTPTPPKTQPSGGGGGNPSATPAGNAPLTAAGGTPTSKYMWALALIQALGGTPTPGIVNLVIAWIDKEGTSASWNPLAITGRAAGSTSFNSVGVQNFTSFQQGVQATAQFIQNGRYNNIVAAIRLGDPNVALAHLNEFNTWGGSAGYGASLVGIYQRVSGDPHAGAGGLIAAGGAGGPGNTAGAGGPVADYILRTDPSLEWALGVPELAGILQQAANSRYDDAKLTAALTGSDYYRSHSAQVRAWQTLQSTDPATAARDLQAAEAALRAQALALGITLSDSALAGLAMGHQMFGWTADEDRQHLLSAGAFSQSGTLGAVGDGAVQAKQLFAQYGIKLDDQTAQTYGMQINVATSATQALENLRPIAIQQAKGLYPHLADLLDKGVTVANVFAPYQSDAAQLLSVDATTIDLTDPKWSRFLEGEQPMSRQQARATVQTDPIYHWDTSENGRTSAFALRDQLAKTFGVSG